MSKFHDDSTTASDPLAIDLSESKLRQLQPELYGWRAWFISFSWGNQRIGARAITAMLREHLSFGDSRAALVVQIAPHLIVAAYTDEQDAVLLLQFPDFLTDQYALHVGSRLLTVNTYGEAKRVAADIVEGPACTHRYANLYPLIAEFLSDDLNLISQRKQSIVEAEWNRAAQFAQARLAARQVVVRDGRPLYSHLPAKPIVLSSSSAR